MKAFKLYANCIPVKGASVSIICDLQRGRYVYVDNDICDILLEGANMEMESLGGGEIKDYVNYLIDEGYGFCTEEPHRFPSLDMYFESPELINNAIVDIGEDSVHDFELIFTQLGEVGCKFLELRFYKFVSLDELGKILQYSRKTRLKNIGVYIKYGPDYDESALQIFFMQNQIVGDVVVHSAPYAKNCFELVKKNFVFTKQAIDSSDCCGTIVRQYFSVNVETFTEARQFNSCLNKKISIDVDGNIRNCPSMKQAFGHTGKNRLMQVAMDKAFQEIWSVNKDQIDVCRDCQFRYICTDCRAFVTGRIDKPQKCNYDPYKNEWVAPLLS